VPVRERWALVLLPDFCAFRKSSNSLSSFAALTAFGQVECCPLHLGFSCLIIPALIYIYVLSMLFLDFLSAIAALLVYPSFLSLLIRTQSSLQVMDPSEGTMRRIHK
jgi:hypothetical protein